MGITVNLGCRSGLLRCGDRLTLVGDDLVVAACDILARLELLGLIDNALLKFGQVGAGIGKCLFRGVHLAHGRGALGNKGAHGVRGVRDSGPQIAVRVGGVRGDRASGVDSVRIGSLRRGDIAGTALDHRKARCVRIDRIGANRGVLELQKRGHGAALVGNGGLAGYKGRGRLGGLLFLGINIGIGHGVFHRFDGIHHGVHDGIELFFRRHLDGARCLRGVVLYRGVVLSGRIVVLLIGVFCFGGFRRSAFVQDGVVDVDTIAGHSVSICGDVCGIINMLLSLGVQLVCHRHVLLIVVCHPMIKSRADIPRAAAKFQNVFDGSI